MFKTLRWIGSLKLAMIVNLERELSRELQSRLVLPLAITLMERVPDPGTLLTVSREGDSIRVKLLETTQSRAAAQLKAPIKLDGKSLNPEEIGQGIQALAQKLEALSSDARMTDIRSELETLETAQRGQAFWRDHGAAAVQLQQIEQLSQSVRRVSGLEERLSGLRADTPAQRPVQILSNAGIAMTNLSVHWSARSESYCTWRPMILGCTTAYLSHCRR